MRRSRVPSLLMVAGGVVAAVALAPSAGVTGQEAPGGCVQPYSPVATVDQYQTLDVLPAVDASVVSSPLPDGRPPLDSDGDGADDVIDHVPGVEVRISRGDGDVVLELSPAATSIFAASLGDLDGDGRDEAMVSVDPASAPDAGFYVLPGTTAPGAAPVADVGIRVGPAASGSRPLDDPPRFLVVTLSGSGDTATSSVVDGAAVLAVGAGGDATGVGVQATVAGQVTRQADLGGPHPALVFAQGEPDRMVLSVVDGTTVTVLTTEPEPYVVPYVGPVGPTYVLDGPDGTFVALAQAHRFDARAWMWSLDDPCTPVVAEPTPVAPAAPPAEPVAADASFTG